MAVAGLFPSFVFVFYIIINISINSDFLLLLFLPEVLGPNNPKIDFCVFTI